VPTGTMSTMNTENIKRITMYQTVRHVNGKLVEAWDSVKNRSCSFLSVFRISGFASSLSCLDKPSVLLSLAIQMLHRKDKAPEKMADSRRDRLTQVTSEKIIHLTSIFVPSYAHFIQRS
jgi:hypothetical protein